MCIADSLGLTNTCGIPRHEVGPFYLDISLKVDDKEVFITSVVNFVSPQETGCANCKESGAKHHTATTSTLISPKLRELYEEGKLSGLGQDLNANIKQRLTESLQWKCYSFGVRSQQPPHDHYYWRSANDLRAGQEHQ